MARGDQEQQRAETGFTQSAHQHVLTAEQHVAVAQKHIAAAREQMALAQAQLTAAQELVIAAMTHAQQMQRLALSANEAAETLGVSHTEMYRLLRRGDLKSLKVGRRRLVPVRELEAFIARKITEDF